MKATIEMTYRWNCFSPKQWHQAVNVIIIKKIIYEKGIGMFCRMHKTIEIPIFYFNYPASEFF